MTVFFLLGSDRDGDRSETHRTQSIVRTQISVYVLLMVAKRTKDARLEIRVNSLLLKRLQATAKKKGLTVSELVRDVLQAAA